MQPSIGNAALNYPDHCVLYRFTPRGITEADMEIIWSVRGDAEQGEDYQRDALTWLWHHTVLEDEYVIMHNSAGVNSRFFKPGPYHPGYEYIGPDLVNGCLQALARQRVSIIGYTQVAVLQLATGE
jgi:Rieske 2Fe-2S family protein